MIISRICREVYREPMVTKFGTQIIDVDLVICAQFDGNRFMNYSCMVV